MIVAAAGQIMRRVEGKLGVPTLQCPVYKCFSFGGYLFSSHENPLVSIGGLDMTSSKHDYANYDRFVPNFDMANKTIKLVSVPNLKAFEPRVTGKKS